jgi:uncharacterized FlgJ-related protein
MQNLNSNSAYQEFRTKRMSYSRDNKAFSGKVAVKTLNNYSENGKYYMKMLSQIISKHLAALDHTKAERNNLRMYL